MATDGEGTAAHIADRGPSVGVVGAGAIGGTVAALLDRAGAKVAVTARGEHLAAIRADGLRLSGGFGDHLARVEASEALTDRPDLAILTVKAADAASALHQNAEAIDGVPLLVIQNGLDGLRVAADAAPRSAIAGGLSLIAAQYLEPGRIAVTAALPTFLGRPAGPERAHGDEDALARFAALLGPALPIRVLEGDIAGAQWAKLVINHLNALPAITGWSVQKVVAGRRTRRILTASMREAARVAERSGVRFAALGGLTPAMLRVLARAPLAVGGLLPRRMAAAMGSVPNYGSTLQSIRRGRPTEVDALNGAVVRAARANGEDAPVNAALTAMVHEVEETGRFLDADEVVRRVPV